MTIFFIRKKIRTLISLTRRKRRRRKRGGGVKRIQLTDKDIRDGDYNVSIITKITTEVEV